MIQTKQPPGSSARFSLAQHYLQVAIDQISRYVHLAAKNDGTTASAVALLSKPLGPFPFEVTHVLTDRGSCFTANALEAACERHGMQHRKTRPYTSKTDGMAGRFNGRVQPEVLGITFYSHADLEIVPSRSTGAGKCPPAARSERVLAPDGAE